MPDEASELREIVLGAVEFRVRQMRTDEAWAFEPGTKAPGNPFGGIAAPGQEVQFATGYSGGVTVVPFSLDVSALGPEGTDVLI